MLISDCDKFGFLYVERGLFVGTMLAFCGFFFSPFTMKENVEWGLELSTQEKSFPLYRLGYPQDRKVKILSGRDD